MPQPTRLRMPVEWLDAVLLDLDGMLPSADLPQPTGDRSDWSIVIIDAADTERERLAAPPDPAMLLRVA